MPARTKKPVGKEASSNMRIFLRDSYTFVEPIATSSPNVDLKDAKTSELMNLMPLDRTLEMLCEKEVKEEQDKKEAFREKVEKRGELLCLTISPDLVYYSCTVDRSHTSKKKEVSLKTKRQQLEDDDLMPPPSVIKKDLKKAVKKPRSDSEEVKARGSQLQTRSSARLLAQSINSEMANFQKSKVVAIEDPMELKTPATRGSLRRNRHNIATVTPGPNVNAPQTILRRPNPGETAISLSGSPLLVATEHISSVPQITIPLQDGRVMAVLAKDGLNPDDFPTMDSLTLSRLKMLHGFLGKL